MAPPLADVPIGIQAVALARAMQDSSIEGDLTPDFQTNVTLAMLYGLANRRGLLSVASLVEFLDIKTGTVEELIRLLTSLGYLCSNRRPGYYGFTSKGLQVIRGAVIRVHQGDLVESAPSAEEIAKARQGIVLAREEIAGYPERKESLLAQIGAFEQSSAERSHVIKDTEAELAQVKERLARLKASQHEEGLKLGALRRDLKREQDAAEAAGVVIRRFTTFLNRHGKSLDCDEVVTEEAEEAAV